MALSYQNQQKQCQKTTFIQYLKLIAIDFSSVLIRSIVNISDITLGCTNQKCLLFINIKCKDLKNSYQLNKVLNIESL